VQNTMCAIRGINRILTRLGRTRAAERDHRIPVLAGAAAWVLAVAAAPALAQTAPEEAETLTYPRFTGEVSFEIQNDWAYDANRTEDQNNDLYTTIEPNLSLFLTPELFFNTALVYEPVKDIKPAGSNRYFGDQGLFVEALTVNYQTERWGIFAGKFAPNFGICFDASPGIYGTDVCEDDIEMTERIGFGGNVSWTLGTFGAQTLSGSTFFQDTSYLSNSLFTERGRVRDEDGGPSNTESFSSFAIALDGSEIEEVPGFRYHIGFAMQDVDKIAEDSRAFLPEREGILDPGLAAPEIGDVNDTSNEYRLAIAGEWPIDVTESLTITPLFEYDRFWNAQGIPEQNRDYFTAAVSFELDNWNLALASTTRLIHNSEGKDFQDYLFQVSAGYVFDFGLGIDVGWARVEEENDSKNVLGALLSYTYVF
jgi:hypothetical protein